MKKFLVILLSLSLVLGICSACGTIKYTVTVENGQVWVDGAEQSNSVTVKKGKSVTVKYTGSETFTAWVNADDQNQVLSRDSEFTFTVTANVSLKAITTPINPGPSVQPSVQPTVVPTVAPTVVPTVAPTVVPTVVPTVAPTVVPTVVPTVAPTVVPTVVPSVVPTTQPTVAPTTQPTVQPTVVPTVQPSVPAGDATLTITGGTIWVGGENRGTEVTVPVGTEITIKYTETNGKEFYSWYFGDWEYIDWQTEATFTVNQSMDIWPDIGDVPFNFENVVFEDASVGYNGANAIPEIQYETTYTKDGDEFQPLVNVTYMVNGDPSVTTAVNAGTYTITATLSADNFNTASFDMELTIVPGNLPTAAANKIVTYDPNVAKVEIDVINRIPNDSVTVIYRKDGQVVDAPKAVGTYSVEITANCANYVEKKFSATIIINKAVGEIATPGDTVTFDAADLKTTPVTALEGVSVNNEEQTVVQTIMKGGVVVDRIQDAGSYTVLLDAAATANYEAATRKYVNVVVYEEAVEEPPADADFDIDTDLANISFVDKTVDYNGDVQEIMFTGEYPVDAYTVAFKDAQAKDAGRYSAQVRFTHTASGTKKDFKATFTINKVALTLTAPDFTHVQGESLPNLVTLVSASGLQGADTIASLDGNLVMEHNLTRTSAAFTSFYSHIADWRKDTASTLGEIVDGNFVYPITISGLTSKNYDISFAPGKATVVMPEFKGATTVSPKIAPVDGQPLGLHYDSSVKSTMTLNGKEFYGMGVNYFSIMNDATPQAGFNPTTACENLELLASYNVKAIRFRFMPFYDREYGSFYNYYGQFIQYFDTIVAKAEEVGIGLVPSIYFTNAYVNLFDEGDAIALRDNNSKTFKFLEAFTTFFVNRYAESPAIFIWEFGNEFNLAADNGLPVDELPAGSSREKATWTEDKMTTETLNEFYKDWQKIIRDADPYDRLIGTGDAAMRPAAYHLWKKSVTSHSDASYGADWTEDTFEEQCLATSRFNPNGMNAISMHVYSGQHASGVYNMISADSVYGSTMVDYMTKTMELAATVSSYDGTQYEGRGFPASVQGDVQDGKAIYWGECYLGSGGGTAKDPVVGPDHEITFEEVKLVIDNYGDAQIQTHFPLILLWNYDHNGILLEKREDEHSNGTEWSWCVEPEGGNDKGFFTLTSLKETNDAIDAGLSSANRVASPVRS